MKTIWLFVACILLLSSASGRKAYPEDIVPTENGLVQGVVTDLARAFKGIPYAQPPVGSGRWAAPQPAASWSPNTYNATQFSAGCPQNCVLPPETCPPTFSEDCLYLNIYTPRIQYLTQLQPVMVFLHGGRFEQGAAGTILYEGSYFVNRSEVILVTLNYRLGVLGWLVTDDIDGNFGLQDQRLALKWVIANIKNFGGDPNQITLFGQSAGAASTTAHMMSPLSVGLFNKAIIQSNPFTLPMKPRKDAIALGNLFAKDAGCPGANTSCLMAASVETLVAAQDLSQQHISIVKPLESFLPWTPVVDGDEFKMQPLDAFTKGAYTKMPVILGNVAEEAHMFLYLAIHTSVDDAEYVAGITDIFLDHALDVLEYYPPVPFVGDKRDQLGVIGTDYVFFGSNRNITTTLSKNNGPYTEDVYFYIFDHVLSFGDKAWGPNYTFCDEHVCHAAELPYLFHTATFGGFNFTADEEVLSLSMIDYWTNFARTGNPNTGLRPSTIEWPNWVESNGNQGSLLNFTTPVNQVSDEWRNEYLNYWDSIGYHWGW